MSVKARTATGVILSAIVLIGAAFLVRRHPPQSITEWMDVLAGMSAPLAFIWLVIGYFQQGEELGLNTQALHLQQKELHSQVEQMSAQVEATKDLIRLERDQAQQLRLERTERARPYFRCIDGTGQSNGWQLSFKNEGALVRNIRVTSDDARDIRAEPTDIVDSNGDFTIWHGAARRYPVNLKVEY